MIELRINNEKYNRWISASISRSIDNASGDFSLTTAEVVARVGDSVDILVDGKNYIKGFVDSIGATNGIDGKTFDIFGRDRIADLIDSSLPDGVKNFKSGSTIENIIRKILDALDMKDVEIINQAGTIKPFSSMEIVAGGAGANAFDLISNYARKRGVFLNSDGNGNLILFKISGDVFQEFNFNRENILESQLEINHSERFNRYVVKSQAQSTSDWGSSTSSVFRRGNAGDKNIRAQRYMEIVAEESMSNAECLTRANEESNIRRARSLSYTLKVPGFAQNGKIYEVGKGARVNDAELGVFGSFLIKSIGFSEDENGKTTDLVLTYPDAYSLEAEITMKSMKRIDLNNYLSKKDGW